MKIRFGIMGPGKIAVKFADAIAQCEDAVLYGVASRDKQRAKDFADEYGAEVYYGSYEELAKDENIDIIYISVIHNHHMPLAKLAVENGKAVICEKPLATELSECKEFLDLATSKNVLVMEAMWTRFMPAYIMAKKWIADGKIGQPKLFNASFSWCGKPNPDARAFDPAQAGGALFGVGCYTIGAALDFGGNEKPLITKAVGKIGETNVDELGACVMLFKNGLVANITFGIITTSVQDAIIYGTEGKIVLKQFYGSERSELYNKQGELIETFCDKDGVNGFIYETEHICKLFKEGKKESNVMSKRHSLDCMEVIEDLKTTFKQDKADIANAQTM